MTTEPDWEFEFEERAAILEFEAGFETSQAEEMAAYLVGIMREEWQAKHGRV